MHKHHLYLCSFIHQLSTNHSPLRYSISAVRAMESVSGFCNLTLNQSLVASLTLKIRVRLAVGRRGGWEALQHVPACAAKAAGSHPADLG